MPILNLFSLGAFMEARFVKSTLKVRTLATAGFACRWPAQLLHIYAQVESFVDGRIQVKKAELEKKADDALQKVSTSVKYFNNWRCTKCRYATRSIL